MRLFRKSDMAKINIVNVHADLPSSEYEKMDPYTLIIGGFSENKRIESQKW